MVRKEIAVFLIVGALTVGVDFMTYHWLIHWLSYNPAKACGFITGTIFAYFANRCWTFGHVAKAAGSILRFSLLYAATLTANVAVNNVMLNLLQPLVIKVTLAFLVATGISATLNFIGMKFFVFRSSVLKEETL